MMRRPRSSRAEVLAREDKQAEIIAELTMLGAQDVAAQVTRCWSERLVGNLARYRFTCRSVACCSCRRPPLEAWWRSYVKYTEGLRISFVCLPLTDPGEFASRVSKALRNLRDRRTSESWLWRGVAICGIADMTAAHTIIAHDGLPRHHVEKCLRSVWSEACLVDLPVLPVTAPSPRMLAALAARKRGFQPTRFVICGMGEDDEAD